MRGILSGLGGLVLVSTASLADQPNLSKPLTCHFPDKVKITLSVVALDTIALSLVNADRNHEAYVRTLLELNAINAALRVKYCK